MVNSRANGYDSSFHKLVLTINANCCNIKQEIMIGIDIFYISLLKWSTGDKLEFKMTKLKPS